MARALLVMDFQQGPVDRVGSPAVVAAAVRAAAGARRHDIPVVLVCTAFRPGYPEVSARNRTFAAIAAAGDRLTEESPATALHPLLTPVDGDVVVVKRRVGAFVGGDLAVVLRSRGITDLALAGISTSGVVLTTVREAADRDYRLTVLADACADTDDEVHRILLEKVLPRQADVLSVDEWLAAILTT